MSANPVDSNWRRTTVIALLRFESACIIGLAVYLGVKGITDEVGEPLALIGVILFAFLGAFGLAMAARGFRRLKNYGRAPAILANLIALGVARYQFEAGLWALALALSLLAVTSVYCVLTLKPNL
ncbi:unannotated protein [freshwater metagenome]|uniref:Unannotated protein n=1 Tax=freshwater metagenome TaxID=449393 RepID=A0A6J7Y0F2_9ZZZZ|nr:hypothetical protein [Actinomycetota bacterium]